MNIHDPIDPKAFASYRDYQRALKLHEEFEERSTEVNAVMRDSKNDEEMRQGMEKLGFTWVEDDTCGRAWCRGNEECLWVAVESHQELCNDAAFDRLLAPEDLLLSHGESDRCLQRGCDALLAAWHDEQSREHRALAWFLAVSNAILLDMERDVSLDVFMARHSDLQECYRQSYLCTLHIVRARPWHDAEQGKRTITQFLRETNLLPRASADDLVERFQVLAHAR